MIRRDPLELRAFGERILCGQEEATPFLREGFSFPEGWGRWTDGPRAEIAVRHGATTGLLVVELWIARCHTAADEYCDIVLCTGWGEPKLYSLGPGATRVAVITAAAESFEPGLLEIEILIVRPKTIEEPPTDARALGIGLSAFRVTHMKHREPAYLPQPFEAASSDEGENA